MAKITSLKKPTLSNEAVLAFAEGDKGAAKTVAKGTVTSSAENAPAGLKSGMIPSGDVRLTANIQADLHLKLKIRAAQERTTVGELIESWVKGWAA